MSILRCIDVFARRQRKWSSTWRRALPWLALLWCSWPLISVEAEAMDRRSCFTGRIGLQRTFFFLILRFRSPPRRTCPFRFGAFCAKIDLDAFVTRLARCPYLTAVEIGRGKIQGSVSRWWSFVVGILPRQLILRRGRWPFVWSGIMILGTLWPIPSHRMWRVCLIIDAGIFHQLRSMLTVSQRISRLDAFDNEWSTSRKFMHRSIWRRQRSWSMVE